MLVISPILVLLLAALALPFLAWRRPRFSIYWLVAAGGAFLAWVLVWFLRLGQPRTLVLSNWARYGVMSSPLALLVDGVSWSFALAIATLVLAAVLTGILRVADIPWWVWAADMVVGACGIFAVMAGNLVTLVLVWVMVDVIDLVVWLLQVEDPENRRTVVMVHLGSGVGIMVGILALIISGASFQHLSFDNITPLISLALILGVALRSIVLSLQLPFNEKVEGQTILNALVRLVIPAASLVLLVRTASAGVPPQALPWMLLLTGFVALYAAITFARTKDEGKAKQYFMMSMSSLAVAAALRAQPGAVIAWGLALLFSGGLLYFFSLRQQQLYPIVGLGMLGMTALPFTQASAGSSMYAAPFHPLMVLFLLAHGIIILGFFHQAIQLDEPVQFTERWLWLVYPSGLGVLPLTHYLSTTILAPKTIIAASILWWPPVLSLLIALAILFSSHRVRAPSPGLFSTLDRVFSLQWLYRILGSLYDLAAAGARFLSWLLEGQSGVLWAFLILALLLSLIGQFGAVPGG